MALTIDELNIQIAAESTSATKAIDALIGRLESLKSKLGSLDSASKKASNGIQKTADSAKKAETGIKGFVMQLANGQKPMQKFTDRLAQQISKYRTLTGAFKSVASVAAGWFNESNKYIETLNLFNVTMEEGADAAYEYAQKVQDLVGIDMGEWMQYQGVFKNLTAGFGVASEDANLMSQNLTQLSYDMASFFNTDVETAFDKLSSAMSGQVKGLREFGIDTTVASLQEYALAKGIDTSVRSMTQAEKSMLRYNYIMEKSIIMQGDMARTLVTPANALRVLEAQLTRMKRAFGNIISVLVTQIIPYVQAFVEIVAEAANALASLFGFELPEIDYSNLSTGFSDAEEEAEGVEGSLKKIKKQMMGFDELNIISNPEADSGSAGGVSGGGSLGGMEPLEYDFLGNLDTTKVDEIKETMRKILEYAYLIPAAIAGWKLGSFLADLAFAGKEVSGIKGAISKLAQTAGITIGATLAIVGLTWMISTSIDVWKNGLGIPEFGELMAGAGFTTAGAILLGGSLAKAFGKSFGSGAKLGGQLGLAASGIILLVDGFKDLITNGPSWANILTIVAGAVAVLTAALWGGVAAKIADAAQTVAIVALYAKDFVVSVAKGTAALVKQAAQWAITTGAKALDAIKTGVVTAAQTAWNALSVVGTTVTTALGAAFNFLCSPIGLVVLAIAAVIAIVVLCITYWDEICAAATAAWDWIVEAWNSAATWFDENVIQPIVQFFVDLWNGIVDLAVGCWDGIVGVWNAVANWFDTYVIQPVVDFFVGLWEGIINIFKSIIDWVKENWEAIILFIINPFAGVFKYLWDNCEVFRNFLTGVGKWIYDNVIKPVGDFFVGLWDGFKNGAKKAWEGVKSIFSAVGTFFKNIFTNAWNGIVKVFSVAGEIFVNIKDGIVSAFKVVVNGIIKGLNTVVKLPFEGLNSVLNTISKLEIATIKPFAWLTWRAPVPQIPLLASGGMVDEGQMFIAREAGPELVGSIGRKTAVANNDQIIAGIESGVYRAMVAANANGGGGTQTIRIINEIDGDVVGEKVIKYHNGKVMQTGVSPLLV